jgi:hypothetical protein
VRQEEAAVAFGLKRVEVGLDLKFITLSGTWEPNEAERKAAWELYVELVTRVSAVPLDGGIAREALTSMYALFAQSRGILRGYGPKIAQPRDDAQFSLGYITVALLNFGLRPFLSYWHPELETWEAQRPTGVSVRTHEDAWGRIGELRRDLEVTRTVLLDYAEVLAKACGVPDLRTAIPGASPAARRPTAP